MKRERLYSILMTGAFVGTVLWSASRPISAAFKDEPAPAKIAVVDVHKVFTDYQGSKDANLRLKKMQDEMEAERKRMLDRIEAIRAELGNIDPQSKDYYERRKELKKHRIELRSFGELSLEDAKRELRLTTQNVYQKVVKAIEDVATEVGYDLVLYRDEATLVGDKFPVLLEKIRQRKVMYASDHLDITEPVLRQMNQAYRLKGAQK